MKFEDSIRIVYEHKSNPIKAFVREMNKFCIKYKLKDTQFTNPHGLADKGNHSTAYDIGFLAYHGLKDPLFQRIVSTLKYECITYVPRPEQ